MLTSTEPCDELRPMVTERFFMRYSNSRPSSRATAAAAAAILASEGAGRPPLRPSARTGPAAAAAARHRQGRGRRSTQPDAVRRWLMDGGAGPMRGPHAHGAMAAWPMASGAEASAAQQFECRGLRTRERPGKHGADPRAGERSSPRRRQRRREKGCAEPRPLPRRWRPEGAARQPLPGRPGGEAGQGGAERARSARRGWPACHLPPRSPFPPPGRGDGGAPGLRHLREAGLPPPAPRGPPRGGGARAGPLSEAAVRVFHPADSAAHMPSTSNAFRNSIKRERGGIIRNKINTITHTLLEGGLPRGK